MQKQPPEGVLQKRYSPNVPNLQIFRILDINLLLGCCLVDLLLAWRVIQILFKLFLLLSKLNYWQFSFLVSHFFSFAIKFRTWFGVFWPTLTPSRYFSASIIVIGCKLAIIVFISTSPFSKYKFLVYSSSVICTKTRPCTPIPTQKWITSTFSFLQHQTNGNVFRPWGPVFRSGTFSPRSGLPVQIHLLRQ